MSGPNTYTLGVRKTLGLSAATVALATVTAVLAVTPVAARENAELQSAGYSPTRPSWGAPVSTGRGSSQAAASATRAVGQRIAAAAETSARPSWGPSPPARQPARTTTRAAAAAAPATPHWGAPTTSASRAAPRMASAARPATTRPGQGNRRPDGGQVLAAIDQAAPSRSTTVRIPRSPPASSPAGQNATQDQRPVAIPTPRRPASSRTGVNIWGREVTLVVPLRENNTTYGNVPLRISVDDVLTVPVDQLLAVLAGALEEAPRAALLAAAQPGGQLRLDQLPPDTIALRFNPETTELILTRGIDTRPITDLSVAPIPDENAAEASRPDRFSAFVTSRAGATWEHLGTDPGFRGLTTNHLMAINLAGVVLENEMTGQFGGTSDRLPDGEGIRRNATRLIYDQEAASRRWALGDVSGAGFSYFNAPQLLGFSVSRDRDVFTRNRRLLQPSSSDTFNLTQTSQVDVIVNGQVQRRVTLDPGRYRLTDFPFVAGANDIQVVATDRTGRQETTRFNRFFDFNLLAPGEFEYDVSGGILSTVGLGEPQYDEDQWIVSGSFRRGWSERLTAGAGLQMDADTRLIAGDGLFTGRLGTVFFSGAVSNDDTSGTGVAARGTFQHQRGGAEGQRPVSFSVGAEYTSEAFAVPGDIGFGRTAIEWRVFGGINSELSENRFVTLNADATYDRELQRTLYSAQASFGFRVRDDLFINLLGNYRTDGDEDNVGLGINFSRRFGTNTFGNASIDTIQRRFDAGLTHTRAAGAGVRAFSTRVAGDEDAASLATNYAAQFNRGDLGFDNSTQYNFDQGEVVSSQSSLQAGFAIATAGGRVAVGRPINDSFMIVSAHRGVGDAPIEVDRTEEGFAARTDWLGPALLSNLSSYNPRAITAVTEAASAGMSLDDSSFRVRPTYRSGYAVTVGSEYTITATGRLVDAQGQPVGLVRGVAKLADGSDEKREVEFFSNARGQFALLGLKPGVWRLTTTGAAPRTFEFTVPEDASGLVRLNDVGEAR